MTEDQFVTCTSCPDFDLCIPCHVGNDHGHHPKHAFEAAVEDASLDMLSRALLAPGRNIGHNAICDGCDKVCPVSPLLCLHKLTAISTFMVFVTSALTAQIGTTAQLVS